MLDPQTALVLDRIEDSNKLLIAEETVIASGMTRRRMREFAAGRNVGRRALSALSEVDGPIQMGTGGEPIWPTARVVGSLSHSTSHAVALVSLTSHFEAVGVDIDDERPIGDETAADLMIQEEVEIALELGWAKNLQVGQNIVFSLKEALFKCQYPVTGRADLDFHEVRLFLDSGGACVRANYVEPKSPIARVVAQIEFFFEEIQGVRLTRALIRR